MFLSKGAQGLIRILVLFLEIIDKNISNASDPDRKMSPFSPLVGFLGVSCCLSVVHD